MTISDDSLHFYGREDFWYQTTFVLAAGTDPKQLHATITKDSSNETRHIGTVVVAIYKFEEGKLTLGVIDDFDGSPTDPVVGDWERAMDVYYLEKSKDPS